MKFLAIVFFPYMYQNQTKVKHLPHPIGVFRKQDLTSFHRPKVMLRSGSLQSSGSDTLFHNSIMQAREVEK